MRDDVLPPPVLHLPYEGGPQKLVMGLTAVQDADWLEWDARLPGQRAERARLLAERRNDILADTPGSAGACAELRQVLADWLAVHRPGVETGWDASDHPLASVCPWVAEDFCLMQLSDEGPVLIAAILCFPSRWRLSEKISRPMKAIHTPVPGYGETLGRPVDRFMAALKPGRIAVRFNWSIHEDSTLYQPTGHGMSEFDARITPENAGQTLWLRVERQSFRVLPESGVITFGIGTHVTPLGDVVTRDGEAAKLASAIRGLAPDMERYKSLLPYRAALLDYLDGKAAA
jgi:dimethylamine monooxygenase subunit A